MCLCSMNKLVLVARLYDVPTKSTYRYFHLVALLSLLIDSLFNREHSIESIGCGSSQIMWGNGKV